jgi:hypothetical protein
MMRGIAHTTSQDFADLLERAILRSRGVQVRSEVRQIEIYLLQGNAFFNVSSITKP